MRFFIRSCFCLILLLPGLLTAQGKYDLFLQNEGYYLLTPQEKEKFRALTDEQKELYIRNLWNSLDTNPLTLKMNIKLSTCSDLIMQRSIMGFHPIAPKFISCWGSQTQ